jgi:iron(III) transport system substrate-binding protein
MKNFPSLFLLFTTLVAANGNLRAAERNFSPAEWDNTVKAAKAEKELLLFCEPTIEAQHALMQFQKAYPEIQVKMNPIGAREFATRVLAERRAGKYLADVFSGGTTSPSQVLVPAKALDPIRSAFILPEVGDESLWFKKQFHFADAENQFVFLNDATINLDHLIYNTNLVRADEIQSLRDLLQPKWKGKIIAYDPRLPGGASNNMRFLYYNPKLGPNFIQRLFSDMDVTISSNIRQAMDWLASGKYPLGLFVGRDLENAQRQKLPVAEVNSIKADGAMLSSSAGSIALVNRAPHPNAAKVFINWFLSREGQMAWQKHTDRNSLRTDIPKESISNWKNRVPPEDGSYIFTNLPKYNDLKPAQKIVEEALAQAGKK